MFSPYLNQLEKNHAEMVETLLRWASINSGSHHLEGLEKMLQVLKKDFSSLPATSVEEISLSPKAEYNTNGKKILTPLGRALRIRKQGKGKIKILLNGHMDTVYDKDDSFQTCTFLDMPITPINNGHIPKVFQGSSRRTSGEAEGAYKQYVTKPNPEVQQRGTLKDEGYNGRLQGPGVADMKGGLVVLLYALKAFESTPWADAIDWEILLTPDEEIGSSGSTPLLEEAAKHNHFGLIFEPSIGGHIVRARKGVGNFTFISTGKASHAGRAFKDGINAILPLAELILELDKFNQRFPHCIFNIGNIYGGGATNVVPDHAISHLSIRYNTPEEATSIGKALKDSVQQNNKEHRTRIEMHGQFNRPPKLVTTGTEALFKIIQTCGKEIGIDLDWHDSGGASDGNILCAAGLPNIDNLGVRGDKIHSPDEFMVLDSLVERSQLTLLLLMNLATGNIPLPNELIIPSPPKKTFF